jgi:hypothetical protein
LSTPTKDRFEDRLLAAILSDFEQITGADQSGGVRSSAFGSTRSAHQTAFRAGVGAVAAAALVIGGIEFVGSTGRPNARSRSAIISPAATDSTRHAILYQLASASIAASTVTGPYVVLTETDTDTDYVGSSERTTVINTQTGASTTYQEPYAGSDAPAVLTEGPDPTSTEAWYAALPTDPSDLRTKLLAIAEQQTPPSAGEGLSDDDYVYQEADLLLWSPLVSPTLRSALYKVLATTSGFTLVTGVTDPAGRAAIAMTRHYDGIAETDTTYEDPATGAVLSQVWTYGITGGVTTTSGITSAAQQAAQAKAAAAAGTVVSNPSETETVTAIYEPVTGTNTVPPNPYASSN